MYANSVNRTESKVSLINQFYEINLIDKNHTQLERNLCVFRFYKIVSKIILVNHEV